MFEPIMFKKFATESDSYKSCLDAWIFVVVNAFLSKEYIFSPY